MLISVCRKFTVPVLYPQPVPYPRSFLDPRIHTKHSDCVAKAIPHVRRDELHAGQASQLAKTCEFVPRWSRLETFFISTISN